MDSNDGLIFAYTIDSDGSGNAVDWQGVSDSGSMWAVFPV